MSRLAYILFILTLMSYVTKVSSQNHPSLMITKNSVEEIRKNIDQAPLFVTTLNKVIKEVDEELALGVQVPIPKDMAGGYSHERHKRNFFILQKRDIFFKLREKKNMQSTYGITLWLMQKCFLIYRFTPRTDHMPLERFFGSV